MVAYSFHKRFAAPILLGLEPGPLLPGMKRQTIRADRKRHARPGEELQLYTGMRTKSCSLLGRAICRRVDPIALFFGDHPRVLITGDMEVCGARGLDVFAVRDGFGDWEDLEAYWRDGFGGEVQAELRYDGRLIRWEPRAAEGAP